MAMNPHVRTAIKQLVAGDLSVKLHGMPLDDVDVQAFAQVLATNQSLTRLSMNDNGLGPAGAQAIAAATATSRTLQSLYLGWNAIGAEGARALWAAVENIATLRSIGIGPTDMGADGAQSLAEALENNDKIKNIWLKDNGIGNDGARRLASALDTNRTILRVHLEDEGISTDVQNLVADRVRLNWLAPEVPAWVVSAAGKVTEVPFYLDMPPGFAANAAVCAFGAELVDQELPAAGSTGWRTPGGRAFAAAYLLPLAEAALLSELQRRAGTAEASGQ
jgi:hypothetical protein